ncbi:MAG: JmjC domain-containing protein [Alphaproteobacteria bacterium]
METAILDRLAEGSAEAVFGALHTQRFAHIQGGLGALQDRFGWADINALTSHHQFHKPRLRFAHQELSAAELAAAHKLTVTRRRSLAEIIQSEAVHGLMRQGATLIIDSVEAAHPLIRDLTDALARRHGVRFRANFYGALGHHPGFGLHWDPHDVVIAQFEGPKHWKVWAPTRDAPLKNDPVAPPKPSGPPIFDQVIDSGDLLVVPRGYWHEVLALDRPSVHLTLGTSPFTGRDLLTFLIDEALSEHAVLRRDVPLNGPPSEQAAVMEALRGALDAALNGQSVADILARKQALDEPQPQVSLPWGALEHTPDYSSVRFRWRPVFDPLIERSNAGIIVRTMAKRLTLAAVTQPVVETFAARRRLSLQEVQDLLPSSVTRSQAADMLHVLVREAVLAVEPGSEKS